MSLRLVERPQAASSAPVCLRARTLAGWLVVTAALVATLASPEPARTAFAADAACTPNGTSVVPTKGTQLFDASADGRVIATLTGASLPITLSDLPADPSTGRAKVATKAGSAALRIDGWAPSSSFPTYAASDLEVVKGRVWIASSQKVKLTGSASGKLDVELTVAGSNSQVVKAKADCAGVTLTQGTATKLDVAGNARGYQTKGSKMSLYDEPGKSVVFTLDMMPNTSQLFYSAETRGGFVRVQSRADIVLDGWLALKELDALKKGELVDALAPAQTVVTGAKLSLDGTVLTKKASKDVPVRATRDEKAAAIGQLDSGAEVYVTETVTGWSNVLPLHLGFTAPDGQGFWVPSADLAAVAP